MRAALLAMIAGCGRIAFDASPTSDAAPSPLDVCPSYAPIAGYPRHVALVVPGDSWQVAFDRCEDTGGRLLVPLSSTELAAIHDAFGDAGWIGITDSAIEGDLVAPAIQPGEQLYFEWLAGEPNNGGGAAFDEDCVFSYTDGYNDQGCGTSPTRYVCECDVPGVVD